MLYVVCMIKFILFYRQDELKIGTLVGTDEMGNRYYENNLYFYGNILTTKNISFYFV